MIIYYKDLASIRQRHRKQKIILVGGTFDILHVGHVELLSNAKKHGDILVAAVSSNKQVRRRKGSSRPVIGQADRSKMVDSIKLVDYTLVAPTAIKDGLYPTTRIVKELRPDIFFTHDYNWKRYHESIEQFNKEIIFDMAHKRHSTSRIIQLIVKRFTH